MSNLINSASALMTDTGATELFNITIGGIGDVLVSGLGIVLGLVAVLIGLFFVIRLVRSYIGGTR